MQHITDFFQNFSSMKYDNSLKLDNSLYLLAPLNEKGD